MTKKEFVESLRAKLSRLPKQELEERINFYVEMIDDRMEEGLSEEEAVAAIGSVDEIASQIIADVPLSKIAKEKITPKRKLETWEIVLLLVGLPLWLPLLIAAVAVVFSLAITLYAVVWSLVAALWAIFAALAACAPAGLIACFIFLFSGYPASGFAILAAGLLCAGLAIFLFFGCMTATKGAIKIVTNILLGIKKSLVKKEEK